MEYAVASVIDWVDLSHSVKKFFLQTYMVLLLVYHKIYRLMSCALCYLQISF